MRSVRRHAAGAVLLLTCGLLLAGTVAGCATTQDTAALKQAESKRILEARKHKRQNKSHDHGSQER